MNDNERESASTGTSIGIGLIAGFLATIPMTIVMMLLHRFLRVQERYPLPPRIIMTRLLGGRWGSAATVEKFDASQLSVLTLASHFAYGGACGGLFAFTERFVPIPRTIKGIMFGLAVWAGSYLAWLPAFGLLSPATEHPPRRTAVMVAAHIVWGISAGLVLDLLSRSQKAENQAVAR